MDAIAGIKKYLELEGMKAGEVRRIGARLADLERQRELGDLPHAQAPLRLYRVRDSGFVRVLDDRPEPFSAGMLDAIDTFIRRHAGSADPRPAQDQSAVGSGSCELVENAEEPRGEDTAVCEAPQTGERAPEPPDYAVNDTVCADSEVEMPESRADADDNTPCEGLAITETPQSLLARNESVSAWLDTAPRRDPSIETPTEPLAPLCDSKRPIEAVASAPREAVDHQRLCEQWPPQLEERRKVWFLPSASRRSNTTAKPMETTHQPVVYWMRNTLRVTHGNFALEAAILLSRRLSAPLVALCLVPSSILFPTCHAATASDAYSRFSYLELQDHFRRAGLPFYGVTGKEDGTFVSPSGQQPVGLERNPLFQLLDAFQPHAVVTDASFDPSTRRDTLRLARYLELNRASCSWSLLSMDSSTCHPAYRLSLKLQSTLERGAAFSREDEFGEAYTVFSQPRNGTYVFSTLPTGAMQDISKSERHHKELESVLQQLHLQQVDWRIVQASSSQSSAGMHRFGEAEGLQKLSQLLAESRSQPAIQAELQGGGVLSLLPFIRHGSLFAGHVLRRISEAIATCPAPNTPQERKALAMLKVMRSRASSHLGKERDYALYLSLWTSIQSEPSELHEPGLRNLALVSTCETLASLHSSSPRMSSLDAYRKLLPTWVYSSIRFDQESTGNASALYDPYELESARTKDLYWNEIQRFLVDQHYLHPLLIVYWAYRVLTWSVSSRAAVAMLESLVSKCTLGATTSPDAVVTVWKQLFRLGSDSVSTATYSSTTGQTSDLEDLQRFQLLLEGELASQQRLQLRP